jgi:hypothetical protein
MLNYGYVPFPGYWDYLPTLKIKTFNTDIKQISQERVSGRALKHNKPPEKVENYAF